MSDLLTAAAWMLTFLLWWTALCLAVSVIFIAAAWVIRRIAHDEPIPYTLVDPDEPIAHARGQLSPSDTADLTDSGIRRFIDGSDS